MICDENSILRNYLIFTVCCLYKFNFDVNYLTFCSNCHNMINSSLMKNTIFIRIVAMATIRINMVILNNYATYIIVI